MYKQELFPHLVPEVYLSHAAISPLNQRVLEAMNDTMMRYARVGMAAWSHGNRLRMGLRKNLGTLIGATENDIALTSNTSHGMMLVASEYPWRPGDGIVLVRGEFPGNVLPWTAAAKRYDLQVHWLDMEDLEQQTPRFFEVMAQQPRLMAVSWVQFQTGHTLSLQELSAMRDSHDLHICLDAIQGLGPLTLNLAETPFDFVTCGAHKWLLSPEGTAFLYVHPDRMPQMRPTMVGWTSQQDASSFLFLGKGHVDYEGPLKTGPLRYESATMNPYGFAGMDASIALLLEIGPQEVSRRVQALAQRCREGLEAMGLTVAAGERLAGNVCVPMDSEQLVRCNRELAERNIIVSSPDGHLRVAAHFYNEPEDIDRFLEALDNLL